MEKTEKNESETVVTTSSEEKSDTEKSEEKSQNAQSEEKPETESEESSKKEVKPKKKRKKKSTLRLFADFVIKVCVIFALIWFTLTYVVALTIHYGNNMHPAIRDGDLVLSFRLQDPYINSAVVYEYEGKLCVGRVIALGGNEVTIGDNGSFTVDGIIPSEEVFYKTKRAKNSKIKYPYLVEESKAFILNDFRDDTNDSRTFGAVDIKDLDGPILFIMRRRCF